MLDARALRKAFHPGTPNQRVALVDVTLSLMAGDFAVVIGSNGAGKSTLLNAIAGEVRIDAGRIEVDGRDVTAEPNHRRAAAIARVFQDPSVGTAGAMTIEENMALAERQASRNGLRLGLSSSARRRYRERLAAIGLGLENRLGHKVDLLSGGQRQSLAPLIAGPSAPNLFLPHQHPPPPPPPPPPLPTP